MKDIELIFNGPILRVSGPALFVDIVKNHIMEILNDFADTQGMPLYKACQKLIDDESTQIEFKAIIGIDSLLYL